MTAHDDDGDNDPQLKSLRAVWLAMPDEDPPDRGLSELMAAARTKAEEMTTPSLWQRIIALLRRPPVLALASIMVLIGGAVFIGQRRSKLEAPPQEVTQATPDRASQATNEATITPMQDPALGSAAKDQAAGAPVELAPPAEAEVAAPKSEPAAHVTRRAAATKPTDSKPADTKTASSTTKLDAVKNSEKKADSQRDKASLEDSELGGGEGTKLEEKQTASGQGFAAPESPVAAAPDDVRAGTTAPHGATTAKPPPSRATQYLAQAKSAAARGDCNVTLTLLKRVAAEDAALYRKAIAADPGLKKCVVAAQ